MKSNHRLPCQFLFLSLAFLSIAGCAGNTPPGAENENSASVSNNDKSIERESKQPKTDNPNQEPVQQVELSKLLRDIPEMETKPREFKLEQVDFLISTTSEFVVANKNANVQLDFPNKQAIQLIIADELTPDQAGWEDSGYFESSETVLHTEDIHLMKRTTPEGDLYHFRTDINLEKIDVASRAVSADGIFPAWLPRVQCLNLLKTARSITLKEPLPENPVESLRQMGGTVWTNDNGQVNFVRLEFGQVSSSSLKLLNDFMELEKLELHSLHLHPRDFEILSQLPKLRELRVSDSHLGDEGMKYVSALQNLEVLNISSANVTGQGIARLKTNTGLKTLKIHGCQLSGSDLSGLTQCQELQNVTISFNQMTGDQLKFLVGLQNLESFKLEINKGLSDACVDTLLQLPETIKSLTVGDNRQTISDARLAELKKKFPTAFGQ